MCLDQSYIYKSLRKVVVMGQTLLHFRGEMAVHLPMLQSDRMSISLEENDYA